MLTIIISSIMDLLLNLQCIYSTFLCIFAGYTAQTNTCVHNKEDLSIFRSNIMVRKKTLLSSKILDDFIYCCFFPPIPPPPPPPPDQLLAHSGLVPLVAKDQYTLDPEKFQLTRLEIPSSSVSCEFHPCRFIMFVNVNRSRVSRLNGTILKSWPQLLTRK